MKKLMGMGLAGAFLVAMAVGSAAAVPTISSQECVGPSSASNGAWSFSAGTDTFPPAITNSVCSLATSAYPPFPLPGPFLQYESLGASTLNLSGTGSFTCANNGTGTLASGSQLSGANAINTGTGGYNGHTSANIVWQATFAGGVGRLTGTLHGATGSTQPVTGVIILKCKGGGHDAVTVLTFPKMP